MENNYQNRQIDMPSKVMVQNLIKWKKEHLDKVRQNAPQKPYKAPPCPACGGQCRVASTQKPIRQIKCKSCGVTFKD
jgi:hypothetical protein